MKPYGRDKRVKFPSKIDHRLHEKGRKLLNWWEDILSNLSRSTMKQAWRKDVNQSRRDSEDARS
jgi:protein associated with RNAse G/E